MAANFFQSVKNTIYVSSLPWTVGVNELRKYFAKFGSISSVNVVFDKETGLNKGYGFVAFKHDEAIKLALKTSNHTLDGKSIKIALRESRQK